LWDSESYFTTAKLFEGRFPYIPSLNFRAFGYPAFLLPFRSGDAFDLNAIVLTQEIVTLASTAVV